VSGQLDWAGNDIPNVYANYVNLDPLTNHAWFAAGSTVTLWFKPEPGQRRCDRYRRPGGSQGRELRRRPQRAGAAGRVGLRAAASSSSALILPNQSAFLPSDGTMKNDLSIGGSVPDAAAAKAPTCRREPTSTNILVGAGWAPPASSHYDSGTTTFHSGGNCDGTNRANCWTKGGQIIKFLRLRPGSVLRLLGKRRLMSQELQPLGMDVTPSRRRATRTGTRTSPRNPSQWQNRDPLGIRRAASVHPVPELA